MRVQVVEFFADVEAVTLVVAAGTRRVSGTVRLEDAGALRVFRFTGDQLSSIIAWCGLRKELRTDCLAALRGAARPLPWDYGEVPDELIQAATRPRSRMIMNEALHGVPREECLAVSRTTDWSGLARAIGEANAELGRVFAALHLRRAGPAALVYEFTNDPHRPEGKHGSFVVSAQWQWEGELPAGTDLGPAFVARWDGERYVARTHRGPVTNGLAWWQARDAAEAVGLTRTLREREVYHRFEGPDSAANVIELQCFVAPPV
jgi:hypothetical protein